MLKTGRKGVERFEVVVTGRAAHAGTSPEEGVSAILELSRQVQELFALNDPEHGVTVNVGHHRRRPSGQCRRRPGEGARGRSGPQRGRGTRRRARDSLPRAGRWGTTITVRADSGRPPMPATDRNRALFRQAQRLAHGLGLQVDEAPLVGGASDANLTSGLTATLDGLGPVGDGAHAADEHVLLSALPERRRCWPCSCSKAPRVTTGGRFR